MAIGSIQTVAPRVVAKKISVRVSVVLMARFVELMMWTALQVYVHSLNHYASENQAHRDAITRGAVEALCVILNKNAGILTKKPPHVCISITTAVVETVTISTLFLNVSYSVKKKTYLIILMYRLK
jgi:hypothetical protein